MTEVETIDCALSQVRQMHEALLERKQFRGYSGTARFTGGCVAWIGAAVLSLEIVPRQPLPHLVGWVTVLGMALLLNYGALLRWLLEAKPRRRSVAEVMPILDAVPALAVGGVLSLALVVHGLQRDAQYLNLLFGTWMCIYGLVHVVYRKTLPTGIYGLGIFYVACGATCLLAPGISITQPWPMGVVFGTGECLGGVILHQANRRVRQQNRETAAEVL